MKNTLGDRSFGRDHSSATTRLRSILATKRYYAVGASMVLLGNCGGGGCAPTSTQTPPAVTASAELTVPAAPEVATPSPSSPPAAPKSMPSSAAPAGTAPATKASPTTSPGTTPAAGVPAPAAPTTTKAPPATAAPAPAESGSAPQPYAIPGSGTGTGAGGAMPVGGSIQRPSNDSTGNFRISCAYSHMNYDDSIIRPNQPGASHLHTYFGNTGSNALSTSGSLFNSGNSTCDGGIANRSSYWIPSLIGGDGQPLVPEGISIYYKSGYQGISPGEIAPTLPIGLKVIAGTSTATSAQPFDVVGWECRSTGVAGSSIPACGEGSFLQARVEFPQCWDGVNLDSADHKSHMAYGRGGCPASHPVALPAITYHVEWIVGPGGTAGWKLSSDMYSGAPGGYSLHGDIITAWDPAISDQWLNNCVRQNADCGVGRISDNETLIFMVR